MQTITAQQSRDARRELGLSQADVIKALGFPRQYLSEFETGFSTRLSASQLKKLRAFYEKKIEEANANGNEIALTFGDDAPEKTPSPQTITDLATPEGVQHTLLAVRHLAIDQSLSNEKIGSILNKIATNDQKAELLLNESVEQGFLGGFSERTESSLKQVFGLFAENYVLMRHLQGSPLVAIENQATHNDINTVAALFSRLFHEENNDLVSKDSPQAEPLETEEITS